MVSIAESANAVSQFGSDFAGLQLVSLNQEIQFTQYIRYVLPLDGYVFWLKTQATTIKGSLHTSIDKRQNEDETISVNKVVFSTGTDIVEFNVINPNTIWVGAHDGVRFAFTRSDSNSDAAGTFHYVGTALYPALSNMLIDNGDQFSRSTLIVSNSLPMWLRLYSYNPIWLQPPNPQIMLYPSYAVPDNLPPPYGAVHIEPSGTRALQATPQLGPVRPVGSPELGTVSGTALDSTHWQLTADRVRITLYGTTNQQAMDFHDLVNRYSYDYGAIGIMGMAITRDEKRTQPELGILAMKKVLDFDVSYYQSRANDVARELIEHVTVTIIPQF